MNQDRLVAKIQRLKLTVKGDEINVHNAICDVKKLLAEAEKFGTSHLGHNLAIRAIEIARLTTQLEFRKGMLAELVTRFEFDQEEGRENEAIESVDPEQDAIDDAIAGSEKGAR